MYAIDVQQVSKSYKKGFVKKEEKLAVKDVSFQVKSGTTFGLLGPNGAGKTSVIKMMCGLLKSTTGDISIYGHSISKQRKKTQQLIGTLLEGRRGLYWPLTVKENLLYTGRIKQMDPQQLKVRIDELVELFSIGEYYNQSVGELSTGNKQKVCLAASIIHNPKLLLLDEPTLGLDLQSSIQLKELIKEYIKDKDRTIFLTTHDLALAQELCNDFVIMKDGYVNSQFDSSIFKGYAETVNYKIEINTSERSLHSLSTIEEIKRCAFNIEVFENYIHVSLDSPGKLSEVIKLIEVDHFVISDLVKEEVSLEDIFLNIS
jgi:ABC-2 type transport system ATP-binding protein